MVGNRLENGDNLKGLTEFDSLALRHRGQRLMVGICLENSDTSNGVTRFDSGVLCQVSNPYLV